MVRRLDVRPEAEENNDPSTILSALAGIGSGLFKIPEGFVSLGATLIDLGAGTDKAAEVEEFFAKINPFDEYAQATTAGKITELITNIGVPGGIAFKAGNQIAKNALIAKKSGKYLDLGGDTSKAIQKKLKGTKLTKPEKGLVDEAFRTQATGLEKTAAFGAGAGLGGVAEGVAVADVEEAGSFGDLIGGPTEIVRGMETPEDELINRLRFGLEGTVFTGILGGLGTTVKRLRHQKDKGRVANGKFNKFLDEKVSASFRARGKKTQPVFDALNKSKGMVDADVNLAENAAFDLDRRINKLFPFFKRLSNNADTKKEIAALKSDLNKTLLSDGGKGKLKPQYFSRKLNEAGRKAGVDLEDIITIDKKTGREIILNPKKYKELTEPGFTVSFGRINKTIQQDFRKRIKDLGGSKEIQDEMLFNMNGIRGYWGKMFSQYGDRLDDDSLKMFKDLFEGKVNSWLDSGMELFKNDPINMLKRYKPSSQMISTTARQFQAIAGKQGIKLNLETAEGLVREVVDTAELEKGFKIQSSSDPYFKLPDFFVSKSFAKRAADMDLVTPKSYSLKDIPEGVVKVDGVNIDRRKVILDLLGKTDDPMSTVITGTNKLATLLRRNQVYDDLLRASNKQRLLYDEWLAGGKQGAAPEAPIFVNSEAEAYKYFGGSKNDWKQIRFDSADLVDRKGVLKPVDDVEAALFKETDEKILNPLQNKFALNGNVDGILGNDKWTIGDGFGSQLYANLILYPKATSQMANTVLAPFTHARNFLSAMAFAGANGLIPLADKNAVRQAWNALQIGGRGSKAGNELYQKLLRLGVVNSNVRLGDLQRLLGDVNFGSTLSSFRGLNKLLGTLSRGKKFAQDLYTAEDDFWKVFTWFGETKRLEKAFEKVGLKLGQKFTDIAGNEVRLTQEWIEQEAANLVKNQVPNYAFVSEFVKGLRMFPMGNFVSFPAEILRTGTNIVSRSLDEIFYTTKVGKNTVRPFRNIGLQRLTGMATTTAILPYAAVSAGQMAYDVSKEELDAMRRYVADWSKNSTLIPLRDKDGNLEYIDFSHMNAYDTLTRPIQTVLNAVQEGEKDKDGIISDFLIGLGRATNEMGEPFISESIWTEAFQDISPILGRGGRTNDGREIYNPDPNIDPYGTQVRKAIAHLVESQFPLNWNQMKRIGIAMKPVDDLGRFSEYGEEYELGNEAAGIIGMRSVKVDPKKSLNFKITDYKKGIRAARNLFTRETLKGGPITAENVADAYINSNRALYGINREMYKDIEAAKILGTSDDDIAEAMFRRGERRAYGYLSEGMFRPFRVSQQVVNLFQEQADKLGVPNAFEMASDIIAEIQEALSNVTLKWDAFPELINPFRNIPQPNLGPVQNTTALPPLPNPNLATGTQFGGNVLTGVNEADRFAALFPGDELGKLAANKRTTPRTV